MNKLTWVTRGRVSHAYPYQISDDMHGWSVWIFGVAHSQRLARDLVSKKLAMEFAERHRQRESESA